jgi:hypothetical protein
VTALIAVLFTLAGLALLLTFVAAGQHEPRAGSVFAALAVVLGLLGYAAVVGGSFA